MKQSGLGLFEKLHFRFHRNYLFFRPLGRMKSPLIRYGILIPPALCIFFSVQDLLKNPPSRFWGTIVLENLLVYALGYQMLGFAIGHLFFGDKISAYIGWAKDDPFQFEVGLADLGMGALGLLCGWFDGSFWLATIVMVTVFAWGCAVGHIRHMIRERNFHPGNAGYPFWWDVFLPPALILLGLLHLNHGTQ